MTTHKQHTLRGPIHLQGVGLHSGKTTFLTLLPAPINHGVWFEIPQKGGTLEFPARWDYVQSTTLCTTLGKHKSSVGTVEHLLSALHGLEIDNVWIDVKGPEIPILDGSSQVFVSKILSGGRSQQKAPRRRLKVLSAVEVEDDGKFAGLYPSALCRFECYLEFPQAAIGAQNFSLPLTPQRYITQIARARTFGFMHEIEALHSRGLALGASLQNAVGLDEKGKVCNPEGLRFSNELVRHKILDAIGDMFLIGTPLLGTYRGIKASHQLNFALVEKLISQPECWEIIGEPKTEEHPVI